MRYNQKEIKKLAEKASCVEIYKYKDKNHRIHTDYIDFHVDGIDNIDDLPYDKNNEVNADIELMDEEEFNKTILANCCISFNDMYEHNDKILVIVLIDE